jgi:hypothetical protein
MSARTLLLVAALAALAHGQSFLATSMEPTKDSFGGVLVLLDDVDGDGLTDLVTSDLLAPNGPESGDVRVLAGDDLAPLLTIPGGAAYETLGGSLATLGDVNGDGVPEIVAQARFDTPSHHSAQPGMVRVYSGANGTLLQQLAGTTQKMELGDDLGSAGDIDGDGLQDLLVSTFDPALTTRVYSSASWNILQALPGAGPAMTPGDLDLDGVPDIAITDTEFEAIACYSGANGRMLLHIVKGGPNGFGASVAAMGDLDGDGVPDIAVGAPGGGGSARTISGATGQDLLVTWGHQSGDLFGQSVANAGDIDGDGLADLAIGAPGTSFIPGPGFGAGWVEIRSSKTGDILTSFKGSKSDAKYGVTVVAGRDLQGDGFPDLAVGAADSGGLPGSMIQTASARFRVAQITPSEVVWSEPTLVQVHGAGFVPGAPVQVTVEGFPASAASCLSPTLIEFTTPVATEDTMADVVITHEALDIVLTGALSLVGPEILDVYPPIISKAGGTSVTITGTHFPTDGSAVVNFHLGVGTIQSISENGVVAVAPPFTPGAPWDVKISGSTGSGTSVPFIFKYSDALGSPNRGDIAGGTTVVLKGTAVGHVGGNPSVSMGGPCQILGVTKTTITIKTPAQTEATGDTLNAFISDPIKGNEGIPVSFLFTPFLKSTYLPDTLGGGRLRLQWFTSPDAVQPQLVTTWAGAPGAPTVNLSFPAFAGLLHVQPWEYLSLLQPMPQPLQVLEFPVPPYDPLAIGLTLNVQSHVTGEGFAKGAFTNVVKLTLP